MKIVFINNLYTPYAVGGAETVVEKRARDAVSKGNDVVLITSAPWPGFAKATPGKKFPWSPRKGVDGDIIIYRFWVPNLCWYKDLSKHGFVFKLIWHFIDLLNFLSGRIIKDILEKENPDMVETHNLMGIGYDFGLQNKGLETKWKHYLHDIQLVEPSGVLPWNHERDNIYQKIYLGIMKKKFRGVDFVVTPSEFLKSFYEERGFFTNADFQTETHCNAPGLERKPIPNPSLKKGREHMKFIFVGSLVPHKGLNILMQAWNKVCHFDTEHGGVVESLGLLTVKRDPSPSTLVQDDITLHIVGDGVMKEEIFKWAEDKKNVVVHGRLEGEKLEEMYRASDILIFSSTCIENNPTVIHEAMHYGLGVIASDTGGVREILDRDNSWLYMPDDVEELVKRVKRFI